MVENKSLSIDFNVMLFGERLHMLVYHSSNPKLCWSIVQSERLQKISIIFLSCLILINGQDSHLRLKFDREVCRLGSWIGFYQIAKTDAQTLNAWIWLKHFTAIRQILPVRKVRYLQATISWGILAAEGIYIIFEKSTDRIKILVQVIKM